MADTLTQAIQGIGRKAWEGVQWYGLREVRRVRTARSFRNGHPERNSVQESHGTMVEVLADGQFGYAAVAGTDPERILMAAQAAYQQARAAAAFPLARFTPQVRPPATRPYRTPIERPLGQKGAGEINDLLAELCRRLKRSDLIRETSATFETIESESRLVSSTGSDTTQALTQICLHCDAIAEKDGITQRRTLPGGRGLCSQGGLERVLLPDLWERVERTAEEALELVAAENCPTGRMTAVLLPDQMTLQIHESIGHPLELDRILGDERNYAGWSFVKPSDFGTLRYGSELMNVTFDPTISQEFASYGFDDNGCPAEKQFLIKDGLLVRALGGLESQARSGIPGVANARAESWNRAPIDRMANLNLEPGTSTLDEIISSVKYGVLLATNRSWSIDDFRNKFQFGCEYGKLIENGRITRTVRDPNYRGITVPFWRSLVKVGDASTFEVNGTPNCGKGEPNQVITVGHASPACAFENIEVFGGEK